MDPAPTRSINSPLHSSRSTCWFGRLLLISTCFLAGCATMIDPATYGDDLSLPLEVAEGKSVELQFHDVRGDLVALEFVMWVSSDKDRTPGSLRAEVRDLDTQRQLASLTLDRRSITSSQRIRLDFAPAENRRRRLEVRFSGLANDLSIWWTTNSTFPSTTANVGNHEVEGSPALTGYYRLTPVAVFDDVATGSVWRTTGVASMLLLLASGGYLIGRFVYRPSENEPKVQRYAIGICLVMPFGAVIVLWLSMINIAVPTFVTFLVIVGALLALIQELVTKRRASISGEDVATAGALVAIFVATLFTRLAVVRDFVLPLWGDGVHHSLIVQQMLEQLKVPDDYGPLVGPQPFTYHFGFHLFASAAGDMVDLRPEQAVLLGGQVVGTLITLGAFALVTQLTKRPVAGLFSAMIVAFWTVMPAYYVTWARYTHIAGLVSLCGAVSVIIPTVRDVTLRRVMIAAIAAAGLLMVHPRAVVLAVALLVPVTLYLFVERLLDWKNRALAILGTTVLAVALAMPWLIRLIDEHGELTLVTRAVTPEWFPLGLVWTDQDLPIYVFAALAALVAVKSAPALAIALAGWLAFSYLAANPHLLRLPFHLWTHNGAIAISAFLPAAIAAGWGLSQLAAIGKRFWRFAGWALVVAAGIASLLRVPAQVELINPITILARPGDLQALQWAEKNTDPQDLFLISGYRWQDDVYMGTDAGYWLPITSQRATTLPPLIYGLKTRPERERITNLAIQVEQAGNNPERLYLVARQSGARYVFVASRPGPISASALQESAKFELVFDSGRAKIFLVKG